MDNKTDRNPSPPPEILNQNGDLLPDKIGDSLYSKRWLYETLMKIVQLCENSTSKKVEKPDETSSQAELVKETNSAQNNDGDENKSNMIELDSKIEEDACTLWDMSANRDVAEFLNETGVPSIILDIVDKTKSPRLLEIVIGILGNMSSFDSTCKNISENKNIRDSVLQLSGTSDTPTLLQVYRVIRCGVCNQDTQKTWFEAFNENSFFFENLKFVFENSLSYDVLHGAFQLLDSIINADDNFCQIWGKQTYVKAIVEAGKQLRNIQESLDSFFCVVSSLCSFAPNVKEFVEYWMELNLLINSFILNFDKDEPLPDRENISSVIDCFVTYNSLLKSEFMNRENVVIDVDVLNVICKLACSVNALVLDVTKENLNMVDMTPTNDPCLRRTKERDGRQYITMITEYEFNSWAALGEVVVETAGILQNFAEKEMEKEILQKIINSKVIEENISD